MCEAKEYPKENIIQLMGEDFKKENKKQARKTHQTIVAAFRNNPDGKVSKPNLPIESPD